MAESTVASAVQWIGSLLIQEANILCDVADHVRGLQQELELMQQYLKDADAKQEKREIGILVGRVRELAYDAEDVIDMYILNIEAKVEESYGSWITKLACFMCNAPDIYEVGKKIKQKQAQVKEFTGMLNRNELRRIPEILESFRLPRSCYKTPQRRSYHYEDNFECVVGLENDIQKLLLEVFMGEGNTHTNFLSIVGMGGSGKTTLARKLYNHPYVKKYYTNSMAWVSISQEWDTSYVLSQILRKVGGPSETIDLHANMNNVQVLIDELRKILEERSYLVVLDDVWSKEALEQILPALVQGSAQRGSKIIITTRNQSIIPSKQPQEHKIHKQQPLCEEDGWELLSKLTLGHRTNCSTESFERLGKEMLKKCCGLPLAIVALAGILNTRESIGEWQQVSDTVRSRVMEGTEADTCASVHDLLALSYEDLPYSLKPCFLYLGVFPEGAQIPAGMLTRMWIAEGLVAAKGEMSVEDVAIQYLEELSQRFMIQVVQTNFKGVIKAFHLHELLRDLCLKKAKEESFLQVYTGTSDCEQTVNNASALAIQPRRAALHSSTAFPTKISYLRSLVLLKRSNKLHNNYVSKTLDLRIVQQNFKLLRLLNLWGIKTDSGTLPTQIGSFIHLRYLGIRASNVTKLPTSIGKLRNLLTLDYRNIVSDNSVPVIIPNMFGKFVLLRHLYLPVEYPWKPKELQLSCMPNLQILWGVRCSGVGDWFSREVPKLSTNLKKLKVVVTTEKDLKVALNCPSLTSDRLHTFHCEWSDGVALHLVNPIFTHNQHLNKLVLVGKLLVKSLSFILSSNLVVLELKDNILEEEDPMVSIGALAHLKLLKLSNSFLGTALTCIQGSFPVLEELYLASLPKLNTWKIHTGALICLKKLVIIKCEGLHRFPLGLPFVANLEQLECFGVPQEFVQKAEESGWSRESIRLPHNFEAIIEQSDTPVHFSSITKLYDQLTTGIFLNNKTQKFWVVKRRECYYNCFMLYATHLSLAECHPFKDIPLDNCWEWSEIEESEGALITVGKLKPPPFGTKLFFVTGYFNAENLSPEITYEIAYVIRIPQSASQRCMIGARSYLACRYLTSHAQDQGLQDKPKDEWIRLPIGEFKTCREHFDQTLIFRLSGIEPGFEIRGVIIEPKALID